jgi:GntR family transcriptional regulator, transcriptional repressor for pyruvate dehydrogenase complex
MEPKSPAAERASLHKVELPRRTLAETLVRHLQEQILSGRLEPGTPLPIERDIGEAFGVGRATVREALNGLMSAGFVHRQGKKLIVIDPNLVPQSAVDYSVMEARASVHEVFAVRKLLEVEGAKLAAENRTSEDLAAMREILGRMDPAQVEQYHTLTAEFHTQVIAASGNRILTEMYRSNTPLLFKRPAFWRVFQSQPQRPPAGGGPRSHEELYGAIESRLPGEAARLCFEHLDRLERNLVERVRNWELSRIDF